MLFPATCLAFPVTHIIIKLLHPTEQNAYGLKS